MNSPDVGFQQCIVSLVRAEATDERVLPNAEHHVAVEQETTPPNILEQQPAVPCQFPGDAHDGSASVARSRKWVSFIVSSRIRLLSFPRVGIHERVDATHH